MSTKPAAAKQPTTNTHTAVVIAKGERNIAKGACLDGYLRGLDRTPSGKPTFDIADRAADLLRGKTAEEVAKIARAEIKRITGEDPGDLLAKYQHLNPGQIRMNCGNRLRAALKADAGR